MSLANVDPLVKTRLYAAQDIIFNYSWYEEFCNQNVLEDYRNKALSFVDELGEISIDENRQWHYNQMHIFAIGREIILCFGRIGYDHWLTPEEKTIKDIIE